MAQFGIVPFDTIGLTFVGERQVNARFVDQGLVGRKCVTKVEQRLRRRIDQVLHDRFPALLPHPPTDDTTRAALHHRHDVDFVLLFPIKVNNSYCSTTPTSSGTGRAPGSATLCAVLHLMTVGGLTPS